MKLTPEQSAQAQQSAENAVQVILAEQAVTVAAGVLVDAAASPDKALRGRLIAELGQRVEALRLRRQAHVGEQRLLHEGLTQTLDIMTDMEDPFYPIYAFFLGRLVPPAQDAWQQIGNNGRVLQRDAEQALIAAAAYIVASACQSSVAPGDERRVADAFGKIFQHAVLGFLKDVGPQVPPASEAAKNG